VNQVLPPVEGVKYGVNYGFNKIRFVSPVKAGVNLRARISLKEVTDIKDGVQIILNTVFETEDNLEKPAATVEWIVRYYLSKL